MAVGRCHLTGLAVHTTRTSLVGLKDSPLGTGEAVEGGTTGLALGGTGEAGGSTEVGAVLAGSAGERVWVTGQAVAEQGGTGKTHVVGGIVTEGGVSNSVTGAEGANHYQVGRTGRTGSGSRTS